MPPSPSLPFERFGAWMREAEAAEINDPNAMALATVDPSGMPNVRMVLLKDWDEDGFVFYTNLESEKGSELSATPKAALCIHWKSLRRQVRARGNVIPVTQAEADAYFASRPRDSQIGAWASQQSRPLEGTWALEAAVAKWALRYGLGTIPRPPHWSGFRLVPDKIEFWKDGAFRLHTREVFSRTAPNSPWNASFLYP